MKTCIYCGNTLEDQAQFCNRCGQRQQPQYQMPQQPYSSTPAKPVKPPVNTIGLFTCLAAVAVGVLSIVINIIVPMLGINLYTPPLHTILNIVMHVVYIGVAMIGFVVYNGVVQPQMKLSVFWVGIPWGIRYIIGSIMSVMVSALANFMIMEMGMSASIYSLISLFLGMINVAVNIAVTWILTCVILKAVVKKRMK